MRKDPRGSYVRIPSWWNCLGRIGGGVPLGVNFEVSETHAIPC